MFLMVWFICFDLCSPSMVSWIKLNKRKEGENSMLCGGLAFFLHFKQVKIQ